MAFQNKVYVKQGLGKVGTISRMNPIPQHLPFFAEGSDVKAGGFAFAGTATNQVVGKKSDATEVVGLVVMEKMQPSVSTYEDSLVVNAGEEVGVLLSGCAYIMADAAATAGYGVYVTPSTGAITFATSTPSGDIDTGFVVKTAAAAGQPCEIIKL